MTESPPDHLTAVTPFQKLSAVTRAETHRLLGKGGVPVLVIVAITAALTSGVLTTLIIKSLTPEPTLIMATAPIEAGAFMSALVLSIAAVFAVGRDHTGQLGLALSLTPKRDRLFVARILSWAALTAGVTIFITIVIAGLGLVLSDGKFAGPGLFCVAVSVVGSTSMVLIAVALAHIVGRAFGAVLLLVGVNLVLPLGVFAVGAMIPEQAAEAVSAVMNATPTPLYMRAISGSTIEDLGLGHLMGGQLGLAVWVLVLGGVALTVFRRRAL
ncbi:hypothetical protein ACLRGI_07055 [Paenarthrobacter nitroguajacolicus]|uniref:hypothetical protein n=1 Tax=Paenarthrobacter nitroguajacolicus TaxID=211146 RepID=UPI003AE3FFE9